MRILIAGESWISESTHYKGYDSFTSVTYHTGIEPLRGSLQAAGIDVTHMPAHEVPADFPASPEALSVYDVVMLSDIGANSILLHPTTWLHSERFPNRLELLAEWVRAGGGLAMAGGYLSFQGFEAKAQFRGTAVERVLPCQIEAGDDRVETPQGVHPLRRPVEHPVLAGVADEWPALLGHNRFYADQGAEVLATVGDDPLLVVGEMGKGRSLAWASDIAPHWCPPEFTSWTSYGRLFANAVRWLGREL